MGKVFKWKGLVYYYCFIYSLEYATKESIRARPSKIIAGLEPDRTNEFLQVIGRAIEQKIDSKQAVETVNRKVWAEPEKKPKSKSWVQDVTNVLRKKSVASTSKMKKDASTENMPKQISTEKRKKDSIVENRETKNESVKQKKGKNRGTQNEEKALKSEENARQKTSTQRKENKEIEEKKENPEPKVSSNMQRSQEESLTERSTEKEQPKNENESVNQPKQLHKPIQLVQNISDAQLPIEQFDENQSATKPTEKINESSQTALTGRSPPRSAKKESSSEPKSPELKIVGNKSQVEEAKEEIKSVATAIDESREPLLNGAVAATERPKAALRSAAIRPVSARPSAPRRRDKNIQQIAHLDGFIQQNDVGNKHDKKNDIISELDDSDNIIIADLMQTNVIIDELDLSNDVGVSAESQHGHLVKQILETQKTLTKVESNKKSSVRI